MSSEMKAQKNQPLEPPPPSPLSSLPEEIFIDIIARVPRIHHPTLSRVSRRFRSLISSPELYTRRSILKRAEQCIYVAVSEEDQTSHIHWFTLFNKERASSGTTDHRLVRISSLPPSPLHESYVSVGSNIFVMGGRSITSSVSLIDCRSHTSQPLPDMPNAVAGSVVQVVDGKVYVIGGYDGNLPIMMVFDIKTNVWEVKTRLDWEKGKKWLSSVVLGGKILMRSCYESFVYDPSEDSWERDEVLNSKEWSGSCVVEDVLYYYDAKCLRGYDPKVRSWVVVRGLEGLLPGGCSWSKTASYCGGGGGGRMVLFMQRKEVWCAEIVVERRQGGEIWGGVVWCEVVLGSGFRIMDCVPEAVLI